MSYQLDFPLDSPIGRIYSAIKKAGVRDSELDQGFEAITSANADRFVLVKRGDRIIQREEVLNYALNNYLKFQALLHQNGFPVVWSLDDLDPATTFDQEIRDKVTKAIDHFKTAIGKAGLRQNTPAFNEKLALALYYFTLNSPDRSLVQGTAKELKNAGLEEVILFLRNNGGLGLVDNIRDCAVEATALSALKQNCGGCSEDSSVLYAVFKMAGLEAIFIDGQPSPKTLKKYNFPPNTRHVAVGLVLPGRVRIFDPAIKNSDAENEYRTGFLWWKNVLPLHFLSDHYNNRSTNYSNLNDPARAFESVKTSVSIFPYNANRLFILADYYSANKMPDKYIEYLEKAVALDKDNLAARAKLAAAYMNNHYPDKAAQQYELLARLDPKNIKYLERLIQLFEQTGDYIKVVEIAHKLVVLRPKEPGPLISLANAYMKLKDHKQAELVFLKVIIINSKHDIALHNLGAISFNRGIVFINEDNHSSAGISLLKKAKKYFEQALQSDPKSEVSAKMLDRTIDILKQAERDK